jgi:CRP/FNR family cyclic AMP-dependent transcriptional regulator
VITLADAIGFVAAGLMLASYLMKSMLPLRIIALAACVGFVIYGSLKHALPTLVLYAALIPINIKKVLEIRRLTRAVAEARHDAPVADWLLPHMKRREARAGELLWQMGDQADEMVYLAAGELRLVEHDEVLLPGALVGEIGLLSADGRRTASIRCDTDCTLYALSGEAMTQLYYQHPKLGFHVMRLVVSRLQHDAELSARRAAQAAAARRDDPSAASPPAPAPAPEQLSS